MYVVCSPGECRPTCELIYLVMPEQNIYKYGLDLSIYLVMPK